MKDRVRGSSRLMIKAGHSVGKECIIKRINVHIKRMIKEFPAKHERAHHFLSKEFERIWFENKLRKTRWRRRRGRSMITTSLKNQ